MAKYHKGISTTIINSRVRVEINFKLRTISKIMDDKVIDRFKYPEGYTLKEYNQLVESVERDAKH